MKIKNVFISHIHEDDEEVPKLKDSIEKNGCEIRNASIDSTKPNEAQDEDYIKYKILAPRIEWSGALVVLISPDTHTSDWVNWEIEYANKLDKPIVGVWAKGAQNSDIPEAFSDVGGAILSWDSEKLLDAIEGKYTSWSNPDGSQYSQRNISRYSCS